MNMHMQGNISTKWGASQLYERGFLKGFLEGHQSAREEALILVKALEKIKRFCGGDAQIYATFALEKWEGMK